MAQRKYGRKSNKLSRFRTTIAMDDGKLIEKPAAGKAEATNVTVCFFKDIKPCYISYTLNPLAKVFRDRNIACS
jgi:hypothetical protein